MICGSAISLGLAPVGCDAIDQPLHAIAQAGQIFCDEDLHLQTYHQLCPGQSVGVEFCRTIIPRLAWVVAPANALGVRNIGAPVQQRWAGRSRIWWKLYWSSLLFVVLPTLIG